MAGAAQSFKDVGSGTFSWQGIFRRTLTTLGIILGAFVTMKGLAPDTSWAGLLVLMTPMTTIGILIQIVSGLLSQAPGSK